MATISTTKIGNMALSHIGARSSIESLTEASPEAVQVNLWYDYARLQTLAAYDWNFARRRQALALHGDDPPDQWTYRYIYPADCVHARLIWNPSGLDVDAAPFEVETDESADTKSILTDMEDAILIYTFDLESTSSFSSFFVMALSRYLAALIAPSLTGDDKKSITQYQAFIDVIQKAGDENANEQVAKPPRNADWITAR